MSRPCPGVSRRPVSQIVGRRHLTGMTSIGDLGSCGRPGVRALCLVACAVLAVSACSDDDDVATGTTLAPITTAALTPTSAPPASSTTVEPTTTPAPITVAPAATTVPATTIQPTPAPATTAAPTGVFDTGTDAAVRRFQAATGAEEVNGLLGGESWPVLARTTLRGTGGDADRAVDALVAVRGAEGVPDLVTAPAWQHLLGTGGAPANLTLDPH